MQTEGVSEFSESYAAQTLDVATNDVLTQDPGIEG